MCFALLAHPFEEFEDILIDMVSESDENSEAEEWAEESEEEWSSSSTEYDCVCGARLVPEWECVCQVA